MGGGELESSANVDLHKLVLDQIDREMDSYSVNESVWAQASRGKWSNALAHVLEQWYQDFPVRKGTGGHCGTKVKIVQHQVKTIMIPVPPRRPAPGPPGRAPKPA